MKIQVVGYKKVDYFSTKSQKQVTGKEIHFLHVDYLHDNLTGNVVGTQFISKDSPVYDLPLEIGGYYTMYKDGYKVDYFAPYVDEF